MEKEQISNTPEKKRPEAAEDKEARAKDPEDIKKELAGKLEIEAKAIEGYTDSLPVNLQVELNLIARTEIAGFDQAGSDVINENPVEKIPSGRVELKGDAENQLLLEGLRRVDVPADEQIVAFIKDYAGVNNEDLRNSQGRFIEDLVSANIEPIKARRISEFLLVVKKRGELPKFKNASEEIFLSEDEYFVPHLVFRALAEYPWANAATIRTPEELQGFKASVVKMKLMGVAGLTQKEIDFYSAVYSKKGNVIVKDRLLKTGEDQEKVESLLTHERAHKSYEKYSDQTRNLLAQVFSRLPEEVTSFVGQYNSQEQAEEFWVYVSTEKKHPTGSIDQVVAHPLVQEVLNDLDL